MSHHPDSHGHSAYDLLKDFGLPAILAVGTILNTDSPSRFALFLAATVFFGALGLWPRAARYVRSRRIRHCDERFAQQVYPRFRQFVSRFGDFASNRHCDTLHYIVARELSQAPREALASHYLATPIEHWNGLWEHFDQRVRRQAPVFCELAPLIQEFNNLVGSYHAYCLAPVYDRLDDGLRGKLSDSDLRKLRKFQQKHHAFMTDYIEFLRSLSESHPALEHLPRYLPISNPL